MFGFLEMWTVAETLSSCKETDKRCTENWGDSAVRVFVLAALGFEVQPPVPCKSNSCVWLRMPRETLLHSPDLKGAKVHESLAFVPWNLRKVLSGSHRSGKALSLSCSRGSIL